MKTKPIPKTTPPKKTLTQNLKAPKQKFEFKYSHVVYGIDLLGNFLGLMFFIGVIILGFLTSWRSDVIVGAFVCLFAFGCIYSFSKPKPSGYAILYETYVELNLHKTIHLIKYHELTFVHMMNGGGAKGQLVIAAKGIRDIKIYTYSFWFKNSKNYKTSCLPLLELEKALKIKMEEINQN